MVNEGFSDRRGVRPISEGANRVAVIITDGRSQGKIKINIFLFHYNLR